MIVNISYSILFITIFILSIIAVIVTFGFDNYKFDIEKMSIYNFKYIWRERQAKEINKLVFFEGCGYRGGLDTAITILIFIALSSESSLGNMNALFALLGLISAIMVKKFLKEEYNKKAFLVSAILIVLSTIPIIYTTSFKMFLIYNIIFNVCYKITQIVVDSTVFNINENKTINKYKIEYTFINESIHSLGKATSELILFIVVLLFYDYNNIQILVALLSCSTLMQALIYNNYEKIKLTKN